MLIKCPECNLQISDKAISCPHCGYPLKREKAARTTPKKRMRLPNGFGQITLIKNKNLRNPWRAMVSYGKTPEGKPIQKLLKPQSYFKTYNEAYEALVKYHQNPFDLSSDMTVSELYEKWSEEYYQNISAATERTLRSAWKYCNSIYDVKISALNKNQLRNLYENATVFKAGKERHATPQTKARLRQMITRMLDYAVQYDLVSVNISKQVPLPKSTTKEATITNNPHTNFTEEEMAILWQNISDPFVRMVLIGCYMGWRPQELATLKKENVNISEMTITAGMKTKAGKDRIVPINSKIQNFTLGFFQDSNSKYLFPELYSNYNKYSYYFRLKMQELGISAHRPHDTRVTFVTMAKNAGVDDVAIKKFVGHHIDDITETVYTKRSLEWYKEEMKKI